MVFGYQIPLPTLHSFAPEARYALALQRFVMIIAQINLFNAVTPS